MKKEQKQQVSTEPSNVLYTLLGVVRKYIFPFLGILVLIIGNLICYNVNGRLLTITTNLIWCFMIIATYIKCRK